MTDPFDLPNPLALKTPEDFRDLDGLIAVAFDGYWTRRLNPHAPLEYCRRTETDAIRFGGLEVMVPRYSTEEGAVLALLDRVYPEASWLIGRQRVVQPGDKACGAQLMFRGGLTWTAEADTPCLAVIAAMVLALPDGTLTQARQMVAAYLADFSGLAS